MARDATDIGDWSGGEWWIEIHRHPTRRFSQLVEKRKQRAEREARLGWEIEGGREESVEVGPADAERQTVRSGGQEKSAPFSRGPIRAVALAGLTPLRGFLPRQARR
jgi:hypothetical protein